MARTPHSQCRGPGPLPNQGTGPHMLQLRHSEAKQINKHLKKYSVNYGCGLTLASQVTHVVKNWPAKAGESRDIGLIPGLGRARRRK